MDTTAKQKELDPSGLDPKEPGAKLDAEKPDLSLLLLFSSAIPAVADVATAGAIKYSRGGFLEVPNGHQRYSAAMLRHLFAHARGEEFDQDTSAILNRNVYHLAQVAWNALAVLELFLREKSELRRGISQIGDTTLIGPGMIYRYDNKQRWVAQHEC